MRRTQKPHDIREYARSTHMWHFKLLEGVINNKFTQSRTDLHTYIYAKVYIQCFEEKYTVALAVAHISIHWFDFKISTYQPKYNKYSKLYIYLHTVYMYNISRQKNVVYIQSSKLKNWAQLRMKKKKKIIFQAPFASHFIRRAVFHLYK